DRGRLPRRLGGCGCGRRWADPAARAADGAACGHLHRGCAGTNKVASAAGTAVSSWTYVRRIMPVAATAVPLVVCALFGSAAGAGLATFIPKPWLSPVVLAALLVV